MDFDERSSTAICLPLSQNPDSNIDAGRIFFLYLSIFSRAVLFLSLPDCKKSPAASF
jgi:hypothetical protein